VCKISRGAFSWLAKIRNTFLQVKWLWNCTIGHNLYQEILDPNTGGKPTLMGRIQNVLERRLAQKLCF